MRRKKCFHLSRFSDSALQMTHGDHFHFSIIFVMDKIDDKRQQVDALGAKYNDFVTEQKEVFCSHVFCQ